MICDIFDQGNEYKGIIEYLVSLKTHQGMATILKGDPDLTKSLIKSIEREWKFTTGVIAFKESDIPLEQKIEIIKKFEETFLPGLDKYQFNILWIQHLEKGRLELHWLVPRIELTSGKSLSIYTHKIDFKKKDLFQSYFDAKYDFVSAKASKNLLSRMPRNWKQNNEREYFSEVIHRLVMTQVIKGNIKNRRDLFSYLRSSGFKITNIVKTFISVQNPRNVLENIKLKGPYYSEKFTSIEAVLEFIKIDREMIVLKSKSNDNELRQISRNDLNALSDELDFEIEKHAKINREKYPNLAFDDIQNDSYHTIKKKEKNNGKKYKLHGRTNLPGRREVQPNRRVNTESKRYSNAEYRDNRAKQYDYKIAEQAHRNRRRRKARRKIYKKLGSYFESFLDQTFATLRRKILAYRDIEMERHESKLLYEKQESDELIESIDEDKLHKEILDENNSELANLDETKISLSDLIEDKSPELFDGKEEEIISNDKVDQIITKNNLEDTLDKKKKPKKKKRNRRKI